MKFSFGDQDLFKEFKWHQLELRTCDRQRPRDMATLWVRRRSVSSQRSE